MTYVFIGIDGVYKAYGDDLYEVANDLDLPPGSYRVYSTSLMPDELISSRNIFMDNHLTFIMTYTRTAGA